MTTAAMVALAEKTARRAIVLVKNINRTLPVAAASLAGKPLPLC